MGKFDFDEFAKKRAKELGKPLRGGVDKEGNTFYTIGELNIDRFAKSLIKLLK